MKTMTLTGLGSEQNFTTGGSSYFLVFNDGELRVPISEEAAEVVVKEMYGSPNGRTPEQEPEEEEQSYTPPSRDQNSEQEDDDGVGQI